MSNKNVMIIADSQRAANTRRSEQRRGRRACERAAYERVGLFGCWRWTSTLQRAEFGAVARRTTTMNRPNGAKRRTTSDIYCITRIKKPSTLATNRAASRRSASRPTIRPALELQLLAPSITYMLLAHN